MNDNGYELETFKRRVGKTPLLRAKNLEAELGIGEIYMKLEGTNPTGHKSDRIAHHIIRDAMKSSKNTVTLGTTGYLASSLGHLAPYAHLKCVFFVPRVTKRVSKHLLSSPDISIIETGGSYEQAIEESKKQAREHGWYDANPGLENSLMGMTAYSPMAREIIEALDGPPSSVSLAVGAGTLLAGLHLGFRQLWSAEEIDSIPRFYGASIDGRNAIIASFHDGERILRPVGDVADGAGDRFFALENLNGLNAQYALDALHDSRGRGYGISGNDLIAFAATIQKHEKVNIEVESSASLGAFARAHDESRIEHDGKHVIVLATGRTDLLIQALSKEGFADHYPLLISLMDKWLKQFSDPYEEIQEALENAFDKGFVIGAFQGTQLIGICVVSKMELDTFFPTYHLSYIAADERFSGRGIATHLLDKAIELSKGNLSLHVEPENKRAIRLYRKMGLDIQYYRMKYRKEP